MHLLVAFHHRRHCYCCHLLMIPESAGRCAADGRDATPLSGGAAELGPESHPDGGRSRPRWQLELTVAGEGPRREELPGAPSVDVVLYFGKSVSSCFCASFFLVVDDGVYVMNCSMEISTVQVV